MTRTGSIRGLLMLALSSSTASAQVSRDTTTRTTAPSRTTDSTSSTVTAQALFTTAVIPMYLWSVADSLLTHYYPSTTPSVLAQATMPTQVVIGTATYDLRAERSPNSAPRQTDRPENPKSKSSGNSNGIDDKTLGIILGTVLGSAALALMILIFCCLRRRHRTSGSFLRRRTPSLLSSPSRGSRQDGDNEIGTMEGRPIPPIHPALMRHHESYLTTDARSFVTAPERSSATHTDRELGLLRIRNSDHHDQSRGEMYSCASRQPDRRPSMPYSPESITSNSAFVDVPLQQDPSHHPYSPNTFTHKPALTTYPSQQSQHYHPAPPLASSSPQTTPHQPPPQQHQHTNPFLSSEEREADDIVSPMLPSPSRSSERLRRSMVHYPSISEISDFDFVGDGGVRQHRDDDGAWWNEAHQRTDGRHEMP